MNPERVSLAHRRGVGFLDTFEVGERVGTTAVDLRSAHDTSRDTSDDHSAEADLRFRIETSLPIATNDDCDGRTATATDPPVAGSRDADSPVVGRFIEVVSADPGKRRTAALTAASGTERDDSTGLGLGRCVYGPALVARGEKIVVARCHVSGFGI